MSVAAKPLTPRNSSNNNTHMSIITCWNYRKLHIRIVCLLPCV